MAVITAAGVIGLASKSLPEMVEDQEANGESRAFAAVSRVEKDDVQGTATIIDGGTGAEIAIAPGGTLPTGGSQTPGQTQYGPKTILDRLEIPMGVVLGVEANVQSVNVLKANFESVANRMARRRARGFFRKSAIVLPAVTAGDTTFDVADKSWARTKALYDVYNGSTFVETVEVKSYAFTRDGSGNYEITLEAAAANNWSAGFVLYPRGNFAEGFDSLEDVSGSTTFQGIDPATFVNWRGISKDISGALSTAAMREVEDDAGDVVARPDHVFMNPRDLTNYMDLFKDRMRFRTGDKLDDYREVPAHDGKPILAGPEVPEGVVQFYHSKHVKFHEFKSVRPVTSSGIPGAGNLTNAVLMPHPTKHAYDLRVFCEQNIRVHVRSSSPRLTGVT